MNIFATMHMGTKYWGLEKIINLGNVLMKYEQRLTVFMDLLGFSQAVINSSSEEAKLNRIFDTLKSINEVKANFDKGEQHSKMSFFSDSIIISFALDKIPSTFNPCPAMLYYALYNIALFCIELFELYGFLVRGGIAYGDLYHDGNVCFGPALIKAVSLEQTKKQPRVVFDDSIFQRQSPDYIANDSGLSSSVSFDTSDNSYFVDYLYALMYQHNAPRIKQLICDNLNNADYPLSIIEKYKWMRDYFNATISAKPFELEGITEIGD